MEKARLFALYGSLDNAMAALEDLNAAEIGAHAVTLLSPHATRRHGSATAADIPPRPLPARLLMSPASGRWWRSARWPTRCVIAISSTCFRTGRHGAECPEAAEGLRRGVSVLVVDAPRSSHERAQAIIDRHHPIGLDSLGESYLEPGWSRADQIAGDRGVLEVANDLLNVKRPGEDSQPSGPWRRARKNWGCPNPARKLRRPVKERSWEGRAPVPTVNPLRVHARAGIRKNQAAKTVPKNGTPACALAAGVRSG